MGREGRKTGNQGMLKVDRVSTGRKGPCREASLRGCLLLWFGLGQVVVCLFVFKECVVQPRLLLAMQIKPAPLLLPGPYHHGHIYLLYFLSLGFLRHGPIMYLRIIRNSQSSCICTQSAGWTNMPVRIGSSLPLYYPPPILSETHSNCATLAGS